MSVLSWNCRGLGNALAVQMLQDLIHHKRPDFIFLIETLYSRSRVDFIRNKLGYAGLFVIDCIGIVVG